MNRKTPSFACTPYRRRTAGIDGAHQGLLVVQAQAGHGVGKPPTQTIEQWSLILCFLARMLRLSIAEDTLSGASSALPLTGEERTR